MTIYEPGTQIGKYTIVSILGEGGIGIVYKVLHKELDTFFALKTCKLQHETTHERLILEGKVQTSLRHPNIVSVVDMLTFENSPCIVMEYIEGMGLDKWMSLHSLSIKQTENLFLQFLDAIEYAHSKNIIHRDLKPSNILITTINNRPFAKICDFGLAKIPNQAEAPNLTQTGMMMGTPAYMAPEQIRNAKGVDHRVDIFALGAIYYEMITKRMAFSGADTLELLNAVANEPHIPPRTFVQNLELRHSSAIHGALSKNPDARIPKCNVFRDIILGETTWHTEEDTSAQQAIYEDAETLPYVRNSTQTSIEDLLTIPHAESPESALPPSTPVQSKSNLWILGGVTTLLFFVMSIVGVVLFLVANDDAVVETITTQTATTEEPTIVDVEAPEPSAEEQTTKEITPTKTEKTKRKSTTKTKTSTKMTKPTTITKTLSEKSIAPPQTVVTKTPPKEEAVSTGTVTFEGAKAIKLINASSSYPAGTIPVGTYDVHVLFDEKGSFVRVASLTLSANQKKHFRCVPLMRRCD